MSRKKLVFTYLGLIVAMAFWGVSFVWTKIVFELYKPITIVFWRLVVATFILWILGKMMNQIEKVRSEDYLTFLALAFFEPFLYFLCETYGLMEVSPTVTSVMISTIPLFTPIAALIFLNEKFTVKNIIGIIVSIVGVLLIIFKDDFSLVASPKGLLLLVCAIFTAVSYSIIAMKLTGRYSIFTVISYQFTLGMLMFLPLFLIFEWRAFVSITPNMRVISAWLALAIFASAFGFIFFTNALKVIGVTIANSFSNIIPVVTAVFSWWMLGEELSPLNIFGIFVVISGLFISQVKIRRKKYNLKF